MNDEGTRQIIDLDNFPFEKNHRTLKKKILLANGEAKARCQLVDYKFKIFP